MLSKKKALVTGGTGFIGGRLVEKLILYHGTIPQVLVRNFTSAVRLARFGLAMVKGDIDDASAVDRAVEGCDVVFHCAHDFMNAQRNLDGARILAEACLQHKIKRLVYVSSVSVYEPLSDGNLDESAPAEPCGWEYPDNKLAVEHIFLEYMERHGLPLVILQPTIVYGPFSSWTITPVRQLRSGRVVLPKDKEGLCNAVYVDDVVDALILAAQADKAVGERFLISGPAPVTWYEFYAAYERVLGVKSVILMMTEEIEQTNRQDSIKTNLSVLRVFRQDPRRIVQWQPARSIYKLVRGLVSERIKTKALQALPSLLILPDAQRLSLLRARTFTKIDKARHLLRYEPQFSFDRGMDLTAKFVIWAKL